MTRKRAERARGGAYRYPQRPLGDDRRRSVRWAVTAVVLTALVAVATLNLMPAIRKLEHTVEHRYPIDSAQFRREMSSLLGPGITAGNRVTDLQNGDEIFPAMLEAIRSARETITFETFIYWSGEVGERFAEALSERARSGVEVDVIVDWIGSLEMTPALIGRMRDAGVRVQHYRPLRWYHLSRLNYRTHRKLLVVDGSVGFTGGVGIADPWLGDAEHPEQWRDMHFRVEGPVVAQMQAAFNDNWIKTTGEIRNGARYFPPLQRAGEADAQMFISSPSGGSQSMHLMYLIAIAAARQSVDLIAAYFVPDRLIIDALLAARGRGVRIRVLLPGEHIDSDAVRHASRAGWGELLAAGVEIYEYQPTMLHSKLLIVDRYLVSVGSTNFDIRSFRLNDEASLNVYEPAFAARMTATFESDLARSRRISYREWRRRPWTEKLLEWLVEPIRSQL